MSAYTARAAMVAPRYGAHTREALSTAPFGHMRRCQFGPVVLSSSFPVSGHATEDIPAQQI